MVPSSIGCYSTSTKPSPLLREWDAATSRAKEGVAMNHIHDHEYERLLESLLTELKSWRASQLAEGTSLSDLILSRLMLDFTLERLGVRTISDEVSGRINDLERFIYAQH